MDEEEKREEERDREMEGWGEAEKKQNWVKRFNVLLKI